MSCRSSPSIPCSRGNAVGEEAGLLRDPWAASRSYSRTFGEAPVAGRRACGSGLGASRVEHTDGYVVTDESGDGHRFDRLIVATSSRDAAGSAARAADGARDAGARRLLSALRHGHRRPRRPLPHAQRSARLVRDQSLLRRRPGLDERLAGGARRRRAVPDVAPQRPPLPEPLYARRAFRTTSS